MADENKIPQEEIKNLLEENIRLTREIHGMARKIKNYVVFQRVLSLIYVLIIIIPLVLGAIYLPPLIRSLINPYQELLNKGGAINPGFQPGISDIFRETQKILNNK